MTAKYLHELTKTRSFATSTDCTFSNMMTVTVGVLTGGMIIAYTNCGTFNNNNRIFINSEIYFNIKWSFWFVVTIENKFNIYEITYFLSDSNSAALHLISNTNISNFVSFFNAIYQHIKNKRTPKIENNHFRTFLNGGISIPLLTFSLDIGRLTLPDTFEKDIFCD